MTMTRTEEAIIRAIIMAQIASDAGKGIHAIFLPGGNNPGRTGYQSKEFYELRALKMIDSTPRCGINYWVEFTPDQNGFESVLVYFDIKVNGKRYQVSFHNPGHQTMELWGYVNRGRKTRWTHEIYGSRYACEELARMLTE